MSNPHEKVPTDAIRAQNEGDRSDEFKSTRERLVTDVNDWLKRVQTVRDRGGLVNGRLVAHQDRIIQTDFGITRPGVRAMTEEFQSGVSLTGGEDKPLVLQLVTPYDDKGVSTVIHVRGTDPTAVVVHGNERSGQRNREEIAAFGVRQSTSLGHDDGDFSFTVYGDGHVARSQLNHSSALRNEQDIAMAQQAFDLIKADVQFAEL